MKEHLLSEINGMEITLEELFLLFFLLKRLFFRREMEEGRISRGLNVEEEKERVGRCWH